VSRRVSTVAATAAQQGAQHRGHATDEPARLHDGGAEAGRCGGGGGVDCELELHSASFARKACMLLLQGVGRAASARGGAAGAHAARARGEGAAALGRRAAREGRVGRRRRGASIRVGSRYAASHSHATLVSVFTRRFQFPTRAHATRHTKSCSVWLQPRVDARAPAEYPGKWPACLQDARSHSHSPPPRFLFGGAPQPPTLRALGRGSFGAPTLQIRQPAPAPPPGARFLN